MYIWHKQQICEHFKYSVFIKVVHVAMLLGNDHDLSLEFRARNYLWISHQRSVWGILLVCTTRLLVQGPIQMHISLFFFFTIPWLKYSLVPADKCWDIFCCLNRKFAHPRHLYSESFLTCQKKLKPAISKHYICVIILLGSFSFVSLLTLSLPERPEAATKSIQTDQDDFRDSALP